MEQSRFAALTRGFFAYRDAVPCDGYRLQEHLLLLDEPDNVDAAIGPWLVKEMREEDDRRGRATTPLQHDDLHRQFAKLGGGRKERFPDRVLTFANRHGTLNNNPQRWIPSPGPQHGTIVLRPDIAESLQDWRDDVSNMRALLHIWDLIRQAELTGNPGQLAKHIVWETKPRRVRIVCTCTLDGQKIRRDHIIASEGVTDEILTSWKTGLSIAPARQYVSAAISERLHGHVHPTILAPHGTLCFQPDSLLAALYVLFALEVAGQSKPQRICAFCGIAFTPKRTLRHIAGTQTCGDPACRSKKSREKAKRRSGIIRNVAKDVAERENMEGKGEQ